MAGGQFLRERDARERVLPGLSDCGWTMLLILWDAHERKRKLIVSNLCDGAYTPHTTALRHLDRLERKGLIERSDDPHDTRCVFIRPTIYALEKLAAYEHAAARITA